MGALLASAAASAQAAPACTAEALNALHVADLTVTEAKPMAATAQAPAYCQVTGVVVTRGDGAPDGSARFSMQLPDAWKQRFLFLGVGGNAGNLTPSANQTDRASALGKGYVMILTDTGHEGDGTTAKWARRPDGSLDQAKVVDFFYRAAHDVGVAGRAFAQAYYAAPILHAYFDGCSTGGRMAMMEAEHYPGDYGGIIAGDPAMDYNLQLQRLAVQKATLAVPGAHIAPDLLPALDKRVTALCDALDGAKDGLVQDPSRCPVRAKDLICKPGESQACLTPEQAALLEAYNSALRDARGRAVYPGWPITDLAGPGASVSYTFGQSPPDLTNPKAPWGDEKGAPRAWALGYETLAYYLGEGPSADPSKVDIDPRTKVAGDALLKRIHDTMDGGDTYDTARLAPFVRQGGKLILYHGASDPSIPAERTVRFYQELTERLGGAAKTQDNVRLFLVPGMHHCGGGVGPDRFDTLSALEAWVEQGQAPAAIPASTAPNAAAPHKLPLCPYPQQARYAGVGDMADPANWRCRAA
jgi:feruloyl esterase